MHKLLIDLKARIEWCQQQGRTATSVADKQAWWAEEAGLVDALRGKSSASSSPESFGNHLARYHLGLQEGLAIMRLIEPPADRNSLRKDQHESRTDSPGHGQSAQPSGFMASS